MFEEAIWSFGWLGRIVWKPDLSDRLPFEQ